MSNFVGQIVAGFLPKWGVPWLATYGKTWHNFACKYAARVLRWSKMLLNIFWEN